MSFQINDLPSIGYLAVLILISYAFYELIKYLKKRADESLKKERLKLIFEELKLIKEAKEKGINIEEELKKRGYDIA